MHILPLAAALALTSLAQIDTLEPNRQFDFWIGEWDVTNRFWSAQQGEAKVPGAQLQVYPALNNTALVEHYRGTNWQGNDILGYSVRAYDPAKNAWVILLNWPSTNAPFWTMEGGFDFNRGLFFGERTGQEGETITDRYTFSDLLPGFYRWEGSQSTDAGTTWTHPSYSMEGIRRDDDAESINQAWLHGEDIENRCEGEERTQLDFLTGNWTGETKVRTGTNDDGSPKWTTFTNRLTSKPILAGCAHLSTYEHDLPNNANPYAVLTTLAYDANTESWVAYHLSAQGPTAGTMRRFEGTMQDNALTLTHTREDGTTERDRWFNITDNSYSWERAVSTNNSETWTPEVTITYKKN